MFREKLFFIILIFFSFISCHSSQKLINETLNYQEILRTNKEVQLPEVLIISTVAELTKVYSQLQDASYPRSSPIPIFDEKTESIVLFHPKLQNIQNGDFEILNIQKQSNTLLINYKEIDNWEYRENNLSHPILLFKVKFKGSKSKLTLINN